MEDAKVFYIVRYWVDPAGLDKVRHYTDDSGHTAEVVAQPGFLWARKLDLGQTDEKGWHAFMAVYGVESRAALDAYFKSADFVRFGEQQKAIAPYMRMQREVGTVAFSVD